MSDNVEPLPSPEPEERQGCFAFFSQLTVAFYVLLILGIGALGVGAILILTLGQLFATQAPNQLSSGAEMDPWRLAELRNWGVLPKGATPQLYHDHTTFLDGTAGCAVVDGELLEWTDSQLVATIPLLGSEVSLSDDDGEQTVTVRVEGERIDCLFGPDEGGERFFRMLEAESAR